MKKDIFLIIFLFFLPCKILAASFEDGIAIRGDKIYWGGKEFFVNAVGYAPWRPGQWPGTDKVDLELIELDFRRIKEAGFNTIRTWDALTPTELDLAKKYNLKVIQGIWLNPSHDFSEKQFIEQSLTYVKEVVQWSKDSPQVLMYLVMTEPTQEAVLYTGIKQTLDFFKKIKNTIQKIDSKPVSMDSWMPVGFMDHSWGDIVTFNTFMFVPESINRSIGFENYISWIKDHHAKNKPLLIGETGGFSVSQKVLNGLGFGGNTEQEQSKGNLESIRAAIKGGADGIVTVSWVDTWHYPSDPRVHNDHPWEWDGLIGFEDLQDTIGHPRHSYFDIKEFNKHLVAFNIVSNNNSGLEIEMLTKEKEFKSGEKILLGFRINFHDNPLKNYKVDVGFWAPTSEKDYVENYVTDENGQVWINYSGKNDFQEEYVVVSVGLEYEGRRYGDIWFIKINADKKIIKDRRQLAVYIDKNSPKNNFFPSGWVGDYSSLSFDDSYSLNPYNGKTSIKINYDAKNSLSQRWAGIYWQNFLNNWWDPKSELNLRGYRKLKFWAKGERGGEIVSEIGVGGKSPNSADVSLGPIVLKKVWTEYSIDLSDSDLKSMLHGLRIFLRRVDNAEGCTVYLDNIVFSKD